MNYDVIIKFETLEEDSQYLIEQCGLDDRLEIVKPESFRERFIEKKEKNLQMSVLPLHLPTYSKNWHFSFFSFSKN